MSLLHPTTGELYDRLAILTVKIAHGRDAGKDVSHFDTEYNEIVAALAGKKPLTYPLWDNLVATHAAIWPLIETSPPELLRLNAQRVAIRESIDKASGEFRGHEKI